MGNGEGYGDYMQASYMALLPEYTHKTKVVNLARMDFEMKNGSQFCISSLAAMPVMRKYMHLSKSIYVLPRPKIFMKHETYLKMGSPESLSIKKLAANSEYRLALIGGVNHLPIRAEDYVENQHVSVISNTAAIVSIMKMIDLGRIDWSAEFPHILQWGTRSGNVQIAEKFKMVDIEEYHDEDILRAGIACTKNVWGKAIIDQLNALVGKDVILTNREITSKWMPPGDVKNEFFRLNKAEIGY